MIRIKIKVLLLRAGWVLPWVSGSVSVQRLRWSLQVSRSRGDRQWEKVSGMTRGGWTENFPRKHLARTVRMPIKGAENHQLLLPLSESDLNMVFLKVSSASAGSELGMLIRQVSNEMFPHSTHANNSTIHITFDLGTLCPREVMFRW